jgi:hypothetical protein
MVRKAKRAASQKTDDVRSRLGWNSIRQDRCLAMSLLDE